MQCFEIESMSFVHDFAIFMFAVFFKRTWNIGILLTGPVVVVYLYMGNFSVDFSCIVLCQ